MLLHESEADRGRRRNQDCKRYIPEGHFTLCFTETVQLHNDSMQHQMSIAIANANRYRRPDGTIDRSGDSRSANPLPAHKLGPKANTGAINAGLRALDRSGKPCRKWERKGVQIKSFTGLLWDMPSWKAPLRHSAFSGDVKSDSTGSSDAKPIGSSALPSEHSNSGVDGGDPMAMNGIESSPAPPVAT